MDTNPPGITKPGPRSHMLSEFLNRLIRRRRKRIALEFYVITLARLLKKAYGKRKTYSERQVREAMESAQLDTRYIQYALAMYTSRAEFKGLRQQHRKWRDYDSLRQEIADSYFEGNRKFTIHTILDATSSRGNVVEPPPIHRFILPR